jgi:hypothetical protein
MLMLTVAQSGVKIHRAAFSGNFCILPSLEDAPYEELVVDVDVLKLAILGQPVVGSPKCISIASSDNAPSMRCRQL